MCGHSSLLFYSHSRPEKMGCCFSKELNPGLQNERSSLLQPPLHDGLNEVTEQVRQQAAAVAQHVCLEEEETCVPDRPAQRKSLEDEERPSELDNKVWTKTTLASRDSTTWRERDPKPASTHEEKEAIIITTSTNMHTNTDTEAGVTHAARPSCEPAPYMEVLTQSPVRQKILENATLRALWFNQLPEGQKQHKPAKCWSSPARLLSANVTVSEVSHDQLLLVSGCQETQRDSPKAEHKDEEGKEVCVVTTLCQGFERRTQSFYSICSIDADDLEHDHDHSQPQKTAGRTQSQPTAEAVTAALPCMVECLVPSQSHTEASTLHIYTRESKMTSQTDDEEPAPTQSPAAEQSATVLSQSRSDHLLSAKQTTPPPPVVSPQLAESLPLNSTQISGKDPQYSTTDIPQFEEAGKNTHESKNVMLMTSHTGEIAHLEEKNRCMKAETANGSEDKKVTDECVCLVKDSLCLVDHRATEGVISGTEEMVVDFQEKELEECVDSGFSPLDSHLHMSDHRAEQHMKTSSQSHSSSKLDLKLLHEEEKDALPVSGGHTEMDKPPLQSEAIPANNCRSHCEEGDADKTHTEVSSAVSSLPTDLTAFSCRTNLTPHSDFTKTTSHQCDSTTSDNLEFNSIEPQAPFPGCDHSDARFDNCEEQPDSSDVKTEGEVVSCSDQHFQDVLISRSDRQEGNKTKPETEKNSKDVHGGDVTETGQNTSLLERSDYKCDALSELCDNCTDVTSSISVQDPESGIEDSSLSPLTQPHFADPDPFSSSPCTSVEEGEQSFCSEIEAFTTESGSSVIQLICGEEAKQKSEDLLEQFLSPQPASKPQEIVTSSVSYACVSPQVDIGDTADCLPPPRDSSNGREGNNVMSQEEHPAQESDIPPDTCNTSATEIPNDFSCQDNITSVFDCKGNHTMTTVDPDQIDIYASTPSYEIHFVGHELPSAAEDGEREGGMREMVSELLGEDADSSVCRLYPHPWIKLGLDDCCSGWAQGASETEPAPNKRKTGTGGEQIPESVSELQPSMALLGAYPYSTVMPQGLCVWDWHTDCTQSVSVNLMWQLG